MSISYLGSTLANFIMAWCWICTSATLGILGIQVILGMRGVQDIPEGELLLTTAIQTYRHNYSGSSIGCFSVNRQMTSLLAVLVVMAEVWKLLGPPV